MLESKDITSPFEESFVKHSDLSMPHNQKCIPMDLDLKNLFGGLNFQDITQSQFSKSLNYFKEAREIVSSEEVDNDNFLKNLIGVGETQHNQDIGKKIIIFIHTIIIIL